MPRFSEMFEQVLDYNIGWCWRYILALYHKITEAR